MPEFEPGSVHSATIIFSNPKPVGFDYQASLCMGEGWVEMASASFHVDAGQSKAVGFSVTMPSVEGSYPVYFKVSSGGVLIGTFVAKEDVVLAAPIGPTASTTWLTYFVSGTLGGQLVVATVTVSAQKAFIGKVEVSLPGKISGDGLYTPEQWQASIAHYQWLLDNYCPTLADPWRCTHTYELVVERIRGWPTIEGFYLAASGREDYAESHIGNLNKTYNTTSRDVEFPQGETQVTLAFFIPADEAKYRVSDGYRLWCIAYKGGSLTPEVKLYEYLNPYYDKKDELHGVLSLVDDAVYDNAIQFGEQYNGNECALAWGSYPISAEFPSVVRSGEEFWASHTVYITYRKGYAYSIELYAHIGPYIVSNLILASRYYNKGTCYGRTLTTTGEVTFEGVVECYNGKSRVVPAKAEYYRPFPFEKPVPPGTYRVWSRCKTGRPTYGGWQYAWDEDTGMEITVR